eukprot:403356480
MNRTQAQTNLYKKYKHSPYTLKVFQNQFLATTHPKKLRSISTSHELINKFQENAVYQQKQIEQIQQNVIEDFKNQLSHKQSLKLKKFISRQALVDQSKETENSLKNIKTNNGQHHNQTTIATIDFSNTRRSLGNIKSNNNQHSLRKDIPNQLNQSFDQTIENKYKGLVRASNNASITRDGLVQGDSDLEVKIKKIKIKPKEQNDVKRYSLQGMKDRNFYEIFRNQYSNNEIKLDNLGSSQDINFLYPNMIESSDQLQHHIHQLKNVLNSLHQQQRFLTNPSLQNQLTLDSTNQYQNTLRINSRRNQSHYESMSSLQHIPNMGQMALIVMVI